MCNYTVEAAYKNISTLLGLSLLKWNIFRISTNISLSNWFCVILLISFAIQALCTWTETVWGQSIASLSLHVSQNSSENGRFLLAGKRLTCSWKCLCTEKVETSSGFDGEGRRLEVSCDKNKSSIKSVFGVKYITLAQHKLYILCWREFGGC